MRESRRSPGEAQLNVDIPKELLTEVTDYAEAEKVTRKLVVETALRWFLVREKGRRAEKRMSGV